MNITTNHPVASKSRKRKLYSEPSRISCSYKKQLYREEKQLAERLQESSILRIRELITKGTPLVPDSFSRQLVFLDNPFVFKMLTPAAGEHYNLASTFFSLMGSPLEPVVHHRSLLKISPSEGASLDALITKGETVIRKTIPSLYAMPFQQMVRLDQLSSIAHIDNALKRVGERSLYDAILTALFQFTDLTCNNIGIQPTGIKSLSPYYELQFHYSLESQREPKRVNFSQLLLAYLSEEITDLSEINIPLPQTSSPLVEILEGEWQLVFFDREPLLGEANSLHLFTVDNPLEQTSQNCSIIPFHSSLLLSSWRNLPLPPNVIERVLASKGNFTKIQQWIERLHGGIERALPPKKWQQVQKYVERVLHSPEYSLEFFKLQGRDGSATIESVKKKFVEKLSNLDNHQPFWTYLEKSLQQKGLINTTFSRDIRQRNYIATSLHPQITWRQKKALYERYKNLITYLQNYQKLTSLTVQRSNTRLICRKLHTILNEHPTPFSTLSLRKKLESLKKLSLEEEALSFFLDSLKEEYRPTYLNICKVLYPLLADFWDLTATLLSLIKNLSIENEKVQSDTALFTGYFGCPIDLIHKKLSILSPENSLLQIFSERIAKLKQNHSPTDQAFFLRIPQDIYNQGNILFKQIIETP